METIAVEQVAQQVVSLFGKLSGAEIVK